MCVFCFIEVFLLNGKDVSSSQDYLCAYEELGESCPFWEVHPLEWDIICMFWSLTRQTSGKVSNVSMILTTRFFPVLAFARRISKLHGILLKSSLLWGWKSLSLMSVSNL